jgi:hypothetical protein
MDPDPERDVGWLYVGCSDGVQAFDPERPPDPETRSEDWRRDAAVARGERSFALDIGSLLPAL